MEHCIKALCNADVTSGFKIGRDVSLPETHVRSLRNPLRDLGGKPPSQRHTLAFYAGNMHGYLRPILLKYWKDKNPSMKIFGPMPPGVASKMNYIQHMKNSKYCICPKGYEVNSPRVVEAIFYECVPVIISDNFVPPFFEVFNWGAFSVILAEKDIPNLKEILLSIPEKKYLEMQLGVKKVQRHFLWHANPVKYDLFYMTLHSICITSRVCKTLRGSSDDIGWLQHTPGMAPVEDGTARFLELLGKIRNGEHTLPNSVVYLLIPGLFSNHGPLYFVGTKRFFSKMGLACHIAKIHSEASVEHNACELKQYMEELYWGSGKRVMLLGHSKGGVDAAAALSLYWSDLKDKVAGLVLVQSPFAGSPIASDILREGQIADKETRKIMELLICKLIKGDIRALEDLTYDKRREFIMEHKLPEQIPLISFHSEASIALGVLATMTQIAQTELPWLPLPRLGVEEPDVLHAGCQVPVAIPISAAMAACALHLQLRYGEKSDGLVTCRDAEVPGSVVVRPDRKLDHAWMVYSSGKKDPDAPDCSEMCEALLTMLVELGKIKEVC
ncbi:hypothetical protein GH714_025755 [Hevea brasiliensis]|uniref:Exostosin GT47 domain-containing protein n=1 Tax=Hevea brasiliensis TaxID=3981 RepID=A0A6A6LV09_HEVBR|nr:hypothetical protein GH714_025755 [Hevea brasiliensis]